MSFFAASERAMVALRFTLQTVEQTQANLPAGLRR
jgi:hypothetical protein